MAQTVQHSHSRYSVVLVRQLTKSVVNKLAEYAQREQAFQSRWAQAVKTWEVKAAPLKGMPVAMQHDGFPYLESWLGLKRVVVLEPKPGVEPSVAYLATVLEKLKANPAKMVIRAAYQPERPSTWLAERTGIRAVVLPFTVRGDAQADYLYSLFDDTVDRCWLYSNEREQPRFITHAASVSRRPADTPDAHAAGAHRVVTGHRVSRSRSGADCRAWCRGGTLTGSGQRGGSCYSGIVWRPHPRLDGTALA